METAGVTQNMWKCMNQSPCHCYENTCLGGGGPSEGNVYIDGMPVCNHCWDGMSNGEDYKECDFKENNANLNIVCKHLGFDEGKVATSRRQDIYYIYFINIL